MADGGGVWALPVVAFLAAQAAVRLLWLYVIIALTNVTTTNVITIITISQSPAGVVGLFGGIKPPPDG
jgi:hypothetical protein